jgi:hypothetical protein
MDRFRSELVEKQQLPRELVVGLELMEHNSNNCPLDERSRNAEK